MKDRESRSGGVSGRRVRRGSGLILGLVVSASALASCRSAAAKAWNLGQLHDDENHHRYVAALETDIEYTLRHEIASVLQSGSKLLTKEPSRVENPSQRCLEMLVDLGDADPRDARSRALQVAWSTRLAVGDPFALSRERAVLLLGRLGARLEAGRPAGLPSGTTPASAELVTEKATALVRAVRAIVDPASIKTEAGESAPTIDAACAALEALTLDVDGARRVIEALSQLSRLRGVDGPARERMQRTSLDLERRAVRQAIAIAFKDKEPVVRAAAVEAAVECAGVGVLDSMLQQLDREPAPVVLVRVLRLVRERGLPPPPADAPAEDRSRWRDGQLAAIYQLLYSRPQSEIHVAAMQALSSVAGAGFASLREEDWQAWFAHLDAQRDPASASSSD